MVENPSPGSEKTSDVTQSGEWGSRPLQTFEGSTDTCAHAHTLIFQWSMVKLQRVTTHHYYLCGKGAKRWLISGQRSGPRKKPIRPTSELTSPRLHTRMHGRSPAMSQPAKWDGERVRERGEVFFFLLQNPHQAHLQSHHPPTAGSVITGETD